MGAQKTMVLIQRGAYVDLVQGGEIDIAISPQQATISALLTHVRRGDIVNVYSLRKGAAEAIEALGVAVKMTLLGFSGSNEYLNAASSPVGLSTTTSSSAQLVITKANNAIKIRFKFFKFFILYDINL